MKWQYVASVIVAAIAVFGVFTVASDKLADGAASECRDVVVETPRPFKGDDRLAAGTAGTRVQQDMQEHNARQQVRRICD